MAGQGERSLYGAVENRENPEKALADTRVPQTADDALRALAAKAAVDFSNVGDGSVVARLLAANVIKTPNYAFTGTEGTASEVATAGAKMQNAPGGTGFLVAPGNFKVGARSSTQFGWVVARCVLEINSAPGFGYMVSSNLNVSYIDRVAVGGANLPAYGLRIVYANAIPADTSPVVSLTLRHIGIYTGRPGLQMNVLGSTTTYIDIGIYDPAGNVWVDPTVANLNGWGFHFLAIGLVG